MKFYLISVLIILVSCRNGGSASASKTVYQNGKIETKIEVSVDQPADPEKALELLVGSDNSIQAISPSTYKPVETSYTEKATVKYSMIFAGFLAVAAIALLVGRAWFPLIPTIAPLGCAGASCCFVFLPTVVNKYSLYFALGALAFLLYCGYCFIHNRKLLHKEPPKKRNVK